LAIAHGRGERQVLEHHARATPQLVDAPPGVAYIIRKVNMRFTLKVTLVALAAAAVLAGAVGGASASRLSVSNQNFRVVWAPLEFQEPGGLGIRCNITMEGSFHTRTIAKVARSLIGFITRANVAQETCRDNLFGFAARAIAWNGTETSLGSTIPQSLPWHVTYESFSGTLPAITGVRLLLRGVRFTLEIPARSCLASYGTPETNLEGTVNISSGEATTLTPGATAAPRQELIRGECPTSGRFGGNGTITLLGAATRIRITLI